MQDTGKRTRGAQKPTDAAVLEELKVALVDPASTIYTAQKYASNEVRELTKAALGQMVDAHLLVSGVLAGMLMRTDGKRIPHGGEDQERRVLFASYVVGMPLCEQAIEDGCYLQAMTLLRQEMETLAQIVTSHAGKRKPGKQATMAVLGKDIARLYGGLSAAAHASSHAMASGLVTKELESVDRISTGTYFYPVANKDLARRAFALHLVLTMNLVGQMAIDYQKSYPGDGFRELDVKALDFAVELLKVEGMVEDVPTKAHLGD